MPKSIYPLDVFSGGEWSPKLDARVDQQKYRDALRQCLNVIPYKTGGWTRRPGLQYVAQAKLANSYSGGSYQHNYCVITKDFTFAPGVTFTLEFGHQYIRFYSNGQQIQLVPGSLSPWVSTAAYTAGEYISIIEPVSLVYLVPGITYTIAAQGGTTWTNYGAPNNNPGTTFVCTVATNSGSGAGTAYMPYYCIASISGTPFPGNPIPPNDPVNWKLQSILEQPTPYLADCGTAAANPAYQGISQYATDIYGLSFCQINDVIYIVHPDYPPYSLTRFSNTDWVMALAVFNSPALLDQNATDLTLSSSTTEGASQITAAAPNWQTTFFYNIGNTVQYTWNISAGGAGSANNPMLAGSTYVITTVGSVNWTSLGASSGALGVTFVYNGAAATGAGGQVYAIYICVLQNVASASFLSDVNAGYWEQYLVFNPLQVGSTWQLAYLQNSSYLEVDGTASGGIPNSVVTNGLSDSGQIQILGPYELHTYGVWSNNIALQRSLDNGNTWDTVRLVTGRSDRNVDISGTALQLGLYQIVVTNSAALVNPGATNPRVVLECVDSFIYSQFQMTAYETPYLASATILTQVPTPNPGATEYWSEAAWSNYRGFPEAVTSFQQRLIYGGSGYEPQRIWGTVTNDLQNFALGDQTQATDSFAFDLNAPSRGPILWILSQSNNMLVGFAGAEWVVNSGQATTSTEVSSGAITASSINAVENSTWGSAQNVDPVNTGDAALFAQRQASTIRQMQFSFYTAKFMSQDVTTLSDHLFPSGVTRLAYVTRWRRQAIVWATTQQGALLGMTYEQDQQVYGWHRHLTGYNQLDANGNPTVVNDLGFECVSCVSGTGQNDDEVWVVTNRWLANGVPTRFIERFNPVNWEEVFSGPPNPPAPVPAQAFYVDLGSTIVNPARINSGYAYLNGRYIVGLADGNPFGPVLVSAGQVVIPANLYPPSGVGLLQFGTAVGYACQPMRMDADPRAGNTQGVNKSISDLYVRVYNSAGGSVSNGTSLYPYWISGQTYSPGALVRSPANNASYYCAVLDPASSVDPSLDLMPAGHWYQAIAPTYQSPVPLLYPQNPNVPYPSPMFITTPTDIRVEPKGMPSPGMDPVIIIQGNDALPITVLALVSKYGIDSVP